MANTAGDRIRAARVAAGWSQARLADELNRESGRPTLTRHDVSRWESGARTPTGFWRPWIEQALGLSFDAEREASERLRHTLERPDRIDTPVLEALAGSLAAQRRVEDVVGPGAVIGTVREFLSVVQQLATRATGATRSPVVGLLSELHQYIGWLYLAVGDADTARTHLNHAVVAGLEADDPDRTSMGLSFGAYRALCSGDLTAAVALTEAATRDRRVGYALATYNAFQLAEVLARTGDRTAAYTELHRAESSIDQLPAPEDLPDSCYWYTPAFFRGNTAYVLGHLGETEAARRAMRESLDAMPPEWVTSEWATHRRAFADGEPTGPRAASV